MPVVSKLQSGFTSGELDPQLRSRTDVAAYYNGAAKLRNVLVIPQGAVKRRPGLEFITTVPTGSIQMIPFEFSKMEHYLCILTTNLLTIYKNGQVMDTVTCTVTDKQVSECTWAQSYDTLLIFHKDFAPKAFIRATETSWSTAAWTLVNIPTRNFGSPIQQTLNVQNASSVNINFALWISGNYQVSCRFTAGAATFVAGDVGRYIRAGTGYAKITAVTTNVLALATILTPFKNNTATGYTDYAAGEWVIEDEVWSATKGYPACGTFFQGRLYMANTTNLPNTLWGSKVNNENDFESWMPEYDDNGIEVTAGGGLMSNFNRLHSGQHLVALADNGEYYVPSSKNSPVTPTNASLVRNSSNGSMNLPTFEINGAIVYMRAGGRSLIESKYNFADGSYVNKDLSLLSTHLLNNPMSMSFRKQTNTDEADYVLVVNGDGTLSVLCTLRVQEVTAWTKCETRGKFIATAVDNKDMYFIVDRLIGGIPKRCLEKFNSDLLVDCGVTNPAINLTSDGSQMTYDSLNMTYYSSYQALLTSDYEQLSYDGVDLTYGRGGYDTIFNASHLDGQSVQIIIDNTLQPVQTVADGTVTLEHSAYDVQLGINFPIVDRDSGSQVYIETMPIEVDRVEGSSVGKKKRVIEATVMLYETSHCEIQKNKVIMRRIGIDPLDTALPKRTENLTIQGLLGWDNEITVSVGQTLPLPMQLLGLAYKVRV